MSFTLATGIGLPCGSNAVCSRAKRGRPPYNVLGGASSAKAYTGWPLGEHVLGEQEVGGGAFAREHRVPRDDSVGEPGMLAQGPVPELVGVGLGVEAEADLPADAGAAGGQG